MLAARPAIAGANTMILKQRTSGTLPRSEYFEDAGWQGFEIDLSKAIFDPIAPAGKVEFGRFYNWSRALKEMEYGGLHLMNGVSHRGDRERFLDFVGATDIEDSYLVTLAETPTGKFENIEELTTFDLPVQVNFDAAWNPEFDKAIKTDADFAGHFNSLTGSAYNDRDGFLISTMRRIASKRLSGAILTYYTAIDLINMSTSEGFTEGHFKRTRIEAFGSPDTHFVVARHVPQALRDDIHTSFAHLVASGQIDEIWSKWYPDRAAPSWKAPISGA